MRDFLEENVTPSFVIVLIVSLFEVIRHFTITTGITEFMIALFIIGAITLAGVGQKRHPDSAITFLLNLLMFICFIGSFWAYWTSAQLIEGYIHSLTWRYDWNVEEWSPDVRHCWSNGCVPINSYDASSERKDTGRNRKIGENCTTTRNSDGTERKSCTDITVNVYDDYWTYTINSWKIVYTVSTSGTGLNPVPYYPAYTDLDMSRIYGTDDCPNTILMVGEDAPALGCHQSGEQIPHHWYGYHIVTQTTLPTNEHECGVNLEIYLQLSIERYMNGVYYDRSRRFECRLIELGL